MWSLNPDDLKISFSELVSALSDAVDLISPVLNNHHKQVTYISYRIAEALNYPRERLADLITAGLMHDVGALDLSERIELLDFEEEEPYIHTIGGYVLLRDLNIFEKVGEIIKHHHRPWEYGEGSACRDEPVHPESHILYLADRVAVSIDKSAGALNQVEDIYKKIKGQANSRFNPRFVEAFESISKTEAFWMDLVSPDLDSRLKTIWSKFDRRLGLKELFEVTRVFAKVIDFRSRFTAVHSSGVGAVAETIARKMSWPEMDCQKMAIAGNLHDLGKLAIRNHILEKPGKLTRAEYNIMKAHAYHGYYLLDKVSGLERINEYGSLHHERLDGSGYPFRVKGKALKEGSRIMAIADVFTAITEDRPYRRGMEDDRAIRVVERMGLDHKLDAAIIALVKDNFEEMNHYRRKAQQQAAREYRNFEKEIHFTRNLYCREEGSAFS